MNPTYSLRTFESAVAIVTGGATVIGRAPGEAPGRQGPLVVLADLPVELTKEVVARRRKTGGQATAERLDVTDFTATNRLI
jgi:NAD(P)-dependent dehydrogenase (short-subunit alcohol dehydrogenase family)